MYVDDLVYQDMYIAKFKLENTDSEVTYFKTSLFENSIEGKLLYESSEVLGGDSYKTVKIPIYEIAPNKLQKYYACITEEPKGGEGWGVVGRACAKLRLYWPQEQLKQME